MTLFFNIDKVTKTAKGSPVKVLQVLRDMTNRNPITQYYKLLTGNSFLLKPEALLLDKTTDVMYIYQYVLLAARRDYSHYKLFGVKSLHFFVLLTLFSLVDIKSLPFIQY